MVKTINTSISGRNLFVKVKTAKNRKLSSSMWLQRHLNDPYVVQSKKEGYRSRASYKLLELDAKFRLFRKNDIVLDLGAAPGSWAQVALDRGASKVIGVDLLDIEGLNGASFIKADFTTDECLDKIEEILGDRKFSLILSDMASNATGHKKIDHLRVMGLCEEVFHFADENLQKGGSVVVKIFQGGAEEDLLQEIKSKFTKIKHFKPNSSRKSSSEMYLVAQGFKG